MAIRLKKSHGIAVVVVGMLLTYQNCAQVGNDGVSASSYDDNVPFAYDARPDTLAYMSCSEITADLSGVDNRRAYFSYRMGAYTPYASGVTLNKTFRQFTSEDTPEVRAQTLASSAKNGNTRLSFSIRRRSEIQRAWFETPGLKTSIDGFLPPMDAAEVAGPLSAKQTSPNIYTNYFPSANDDRLMEASLSVIASEANAQTLRNNLEQGGDPSYLVMGYSGSSDELDMTLRTPITYAADQTTVVATPITRAYGLGFQASFGTPSGLVTTRRVLSAVTEIDLTTGAVTAANWQCPAANQYMIVRPEDSATTCARQPDPPVEKQTDVLKTIRRVLRTEDWYVDLNNHCVVPKGPADVCYGATLAGRTITYGQSCSFYAANGTTCPHYVSVCVRR